VTVDHACIHCNDSNRNTLQHTATYYNTLQHSHRDDHERGADLKDEELIDFKGKHVAIVEAMQIDLRKSRQDNARLEPLVQELQAEVHDHKEQVDSLRKVKMLESQLHRHCIKVKIVAS